MGQQSFDGVAMHGNVFGVHVVPADVLALDGAEGAGSHVQRHLFAFDATGVDVVEDTLREVQSCCRSRYGALYLGIDRLVGSLVALLRLAVEVGWDGKFADGIDDLGKGDGTLTFAH